MTTTYNFTPQDYLQAISREIQKRLSTYPKILQKKEKAGVPKPEIMEMNRQFDIQMTRLIVIEDIMKSELDYIDSYSASQYIDELKRELKMRKKYYPRLIYFKRITPEAAAQEMAVWAELVTFFTEKYLGTCSPS